jgi:hypothetical protein
LGGYKGNEETGPDCLPRINYHSGNNLFGTVQKGAEEGIQNKSLQKKPTESQSAEPVVISTRQTSTAFNLSSQNKCIEYFPLGPRPDLFRSNGSKLAHLSDSVLYDAATKRIAKEDKICSRLRKKNPSTASQA